jgi:SAM-dependent methyltransferase
MGDEITHLDETVDLNFPECLRADFPDELPLAIDAVQRVLETIAGHSFGSLAVHSPALAEFDWANYLTCGIARMVHVLGALRRRGVSGRVLDYGSYFGNVSLMLREAGFTVDAVDSYAAYGESFFPCSALLNRSGVPVMDFADVGRDLHGLPADTYDAVIFLGVIEHIPHSPRQTLLAIDRVLKPGGHLVVDTPNHSYLYSRQRLARGESVMASIEAQFATVGEFEGHHREYTPGEVLWMLKLIGHTDALLEMFNYSQYGLPVVERRDLSNHWDMLLDPSMREVIMTISRKPSPEGGVAIPEDWHDVLHEAETYWNGRIPATDSVARDLTTLVNSEILLGRLLHRLHVDVSQRDRMLDDQQAHLHGEIELRDRLLGDLQAELNRLRQTWENSLSFRFRRLANRLTGRR